MAGLQFLHTFPAIHRDIKPVNIMLSGRGIVKIREFPFSLLSSTSLISSITLVDYGFVSHGQCDQDHIDQPCGTPDFMAPEIAHACDFNEEGHGYTPPYTPSVDVYAWGVSAYCLLRGANVTGFNPKLLSLGRWKGEYLFGDEDCSVQFCRFLERCTMANPDRRWSTEQLLEVSL